ncbi:hypothetical protein [Paractinoplanes lichenicola]|uniref:Uncharacterized protein n=1 Tax=Paractinoplanes lichenicola TaxID=2802976 RepID=A0ABS1W1Y1_9ACTN|nr:hypothetical protein [Actinoplanes lichenicola]MBL7260750.1 hypothetical protein [Actinoplanes lichenicola]
MRRSIRSLLIESIRLWQQEQFHRFNDHETSSTVRLYYWAVQVVRSSPELSFFRVQYDGPQPTAAMLAGSEDPARAPRPDINVSLGQDIVVHVEAKRLKSGDGLPKKYVTQGMRRFVDGRYDTRPCNLGGMLGYIMDGDSAKAIAQINQTISDEADFGPNAALRAQGSPLPFIGEYVSDHGSFSLIHLAIDVA